MSALVLSQTANRGPGSITFELSGNKITFNFSEVKKSSGYYILEFRSALGFSDTAETRKVVFDLLVAKNLDCESARNSPKLNVEEKIEAVFSLEFILSPSFSDICIKSENQHGQVVEALNPNLYSKLSYLLNN